MNLFALYLLLIINTAVSNKISFPFLPDLSRLLDQYDSHYFISFTPDKIHNLEERIHKFCGSKFEGTCMIHAFNEKLMKSQNLLTTKFITQFVNVQFLGAAGPKRKIDYGYYKNPFIWLYLINRPDYQLYFTLRRKLTSSILLVVTVRKVFLVCPICTMIYWELGSWEYFPMQAFWYIVFSKHGSLHDFYGQVQKVDANNLCDLSKRR